MHELTETLRRAVDDDVRPVAAGEVYDMVGRRQGAQAVVRVPRLGVVGRFAVGLVVVGLVAGLLAVVVVVAGNGGGRGRVGVRSAGTAPSLSVLDRAPTENDVVAPPASSSVDTTVVVPGSLRLAVDVDGWQAFIGRAAAGVDGDYCMLTVTPVSAERGMSTSFGCSHLADLAKDGADLLRYPDDGSGRGAIVGFVPDGTVSVEVEGAKAVLGDNAFIARGIDPTHPVDVTIVSNEGTRSIVVPRPLVVPDGKASTPLTQTPHSNHP